MAELAIPLVALGGMWVISQFENKNKNGNSIKGTSNTDMATYNGSITESYVNLNKAKITSAFPTPKNVTQNNNINYYPNANQSTDKYFNENNFEKVSAQANINSGVGNNKNTTITSMTGHTMDKGEFKHNNMVPFFGSKIKGATADFNGRESILDNLQGNGSQQKRKEEVAPLFNPETNVQYTHGVPNQTEFMMSRVNQSMKMSNVTPWDQIQVGPGLNQGYGTAGSAGFNSGMEARQEWMPKTVDQLRVETNPKLTFGLNGHQGPAIAPVINLGLEGKVEKNQPDTYYTLGPDRWFTTTGAEKAQTARGIEILQDQNRQCTTGEYFGNVAVGDGEATYVNGVHETPKRPVLNSNATMAAHARQQNTISSTDYGIKGYKALPNNRSTTQHELELNPISGIGKAVIAPLLDFLRPTKKENVVGNLRLNGNMNNNNTRNYVYNPNDKTKITNRQMTERKVDMNHLNVDGAQARDGYMVSRQQPTNVQRDTTSYYHMGGVGGGTNAEGDMSYVSAYKQRNNVNKRQNNVVKPGGTQMFNGQANLSTIRPDCDRVNQRNNVPNGGPSIISSTMNYGGLQNMQSLSESVNMARMQPDILTAFKQNPYTQSLHSFA